MESFIVRIYRREEADGAAATGPVGTVEAAATGARTAFHSHQELLSALGAAGGTAPAPAKPRRAAATARAKK